MLLKIDAVLQEAILDLPPKEKDKLLLRLIRKDKTLINQLHFQLLEDQDDLEERRKDTLSRLNAAISNMRTRLETKRHYSSKDLLIALRAMSGIVNQHVLITKDKIGELELRIHILAEAFNHAPEYFQNAAFGNEKLLKYGQARIKNLLGLYEKLHEDLRFDYQESVDQVLEFGESAGFIARSR